MGKLIFLFVLTLSLSNAFARGEPITFKTTTTVNRSLDEILTVAMDVNNTCEKGCHFKVSNVVEGKYVDTMAPQKYFLWEHISSGSVFVDDTKQYRYISYSKSEDGTSAKIYSRFPTASDLKILKNKFSYPHKTLFNFFEMIVDLNIVGYRRGIPVVKIDYSVSIASDSSLINSFKDKVKKELERTARENFYNYQNR